MRIESVSPEYDLKQLEHNLVSISRIKDAECPYRYYRNYLERPKPVAHFESIEAGMGRFFHSCLEAHFRRLFNSGETVVSRSHLLDPASIVRDFRLAFLWNGEIRSPYKIVRSTYSLDDFESRLAAAAANWNKFCCDNLIGQSVVSVEGDLEIVTDVCRIRGRHDLVTRDRSGTMVLWDWKTGAAPSPEYFTDYRNQKIQLGIYAIWMRRFYDAEDVRGVAVFLRNGPTAVSESFSPEVERDVLAYCAEWRSRMNLLKHFPPVPNNLCDWCGWNPSCSGYSSRRVYVSRPGFAGTVSSGLSSPNPPVTRLHRDSHPKGKGPGCVVLVMTGVGITSAAALCRLIVS